MTYLDPSLGRSFTYVITMLGFMPSVKEILLSGGLRVAKTCDGRTAGANFPDRRPKRHCLGSATLQSRSLPPHSHFLSLSFWTFTNYLCFLCSLIVLSFLVSAGVACHPHLLPRAHRLPPHLQSSSGPLIPREIREIARIQDESVSSLSDCCANRCPRR
jgi:hypothetical protein